MKRSLSLLIFLMALVGGCIGTSFNKRGRDLKPNERIPELHEVPDMHEIKPLPRKEMEAKEKELRAQYKKDSVNLP